MASPVPIKTIETEALKEGSALKALEVLRRVLKEDPRPSAALLLTKFEKRARAEEKEAERLGSLMRYEDEAASRGFRLVAGLDEAGRGPLVGPVVAAAVILPPGSRLKGVDDSKKLTAEKREELYSRIKGSAVSVGLGQADAGEIDRHNIYRASQLAMERAVAALTVRPDFLLTDAMPLPKLSPLPQKPLIHGDALSASIAAASIIAKVSRDRMMAELNEKYPEYGFDRHKGYGTVEHLKALREKGVCPEHRMTFAPVAEVLSRRTDGGPFEYWKAQLVQAVNLRELDRVGRQIKRAALPLLSGEDVEALRELFREKRDGWTEQGK